MPSRRCLFVPSLFLNRWCFCLLGGCFFRYIFVVASYRAFCACCLFFVICCSVTYLFLLVLCVFLFRVFLISLLVMGCCCSWLQSLCYLFVSLFIGVVYSFVAFMVSSWLLYCIFFLAAVCRLFVYPLSVGFVYVSSFFVAYLVIICSLFLSFLSFLWFCVSFVASLLYLWFLFDSSVAFSSCSCYLLPCLFYIGYGLLVPSRPLMICSSFVSMLFTLAVVVVNVCVLRCAVDLLFLRYLLLICCTFVTFGYMLFLCIFVICCVFVSCASAVSCYLLFMRCFFVISLLFIRWSVLSLLLCCYIAAHFILYSLFILVDVTLLLRCCVIVCLLLCCCFFVSVLFRLSFFVLLLLFIGCLLLLLCVGCFLLMCLSIVVFIISFF